jgi:hypothetical protein
LATMPRAPRLVRRKADTFWSSVHVRDTLGTALHCTALKLQACIVTDDEEHSPSLSHVGLVDWNVSKALDHRHPALWGGQRQATLGT